MSGWEVGDLALCVRARPGQMRRAPNPCKVGVIYKVDKVVVCRDTGVLGLGFEGINFPDCKLNATSACDFRKIKPDTEPCEEEFTVLIKRGKKVSA